MPDIHPARRCDKLTRAQWQRIADATQAVLEAAIRYEGSTLGRRHLPQCAQSIGWVSEPSSCVRPRRIGRVRAADRVAASCESCKLSVRRFFAPVVSENGRRVGVCPSNFALVARFRSNVGRHAGFDLFQLGRKVAVMESHTQQTKPYGIEIDSNDLVIAARNRAETRRIPRRDFLTVAGGAVLGASAIGGVLPAGRVWAKPKIASSRYGRRCRKVFARVAGEGAFRHALAQAA